MLSVVIITKNEEANIRRCLSSVQWADEIIVLDSGSEDNTVAIAKEFTDKVFETTWSEWKGYGVQKQRALEHTRSDWVLNLDADESVDDHLKLAIIAAIKSNKYDAYRVPIRMCFYEKLLRYSASPKRHIRLFKRNGASYSKDIVHEKILLPEGTKIGQFQAAIIHHGIRDISHLLYKINHYSSCSAKTRLDEKKQTNLFKTLCGASWMFFRCYILQRGFLDGKEGLLFAFFNAQGTFYRGIKQIYCDRYVSQNHNEK